MSSIMYGCFGENMKFFEKQLYNLRLFLSNNNKYNVFELKGNNYLFGSVQTDNKKRCAFLPQRNISVVMNGHVYGSDQLNAGNDIDIIANAYHSGKKNFAKTIYGTFASIIYDHGSSSLTVVNDILGLQPLFFTGQNKTYFFVSEAEALVKCGLVKPELNYNALAELFTVGFIIGDGTLLKNVHRVRPFSHILYNSHKFSISLNEQRFPSGIAGNNPKDWYCTVDTLLKNYILKIAKYVGTDNLLLNLSGGLDSRLILSNLLKKNIYFEALTSSDPFSEDIDDVKYTHLLAQKFKFQHNIEHDTSGELSSYQFLLNSRLLNHTHKICGHGGEILRGKFYKRIRPDTGSITEKTLKRLFTKSFINNMSTSPCVKLRSEIDLINHDCQFKKREMVYVYHISSFFRRDNPNVHRFCNAFLRKLHFPYFNCRLVEYIADIPHIYFENNKFFINLFEKMHHKLLNIPSTTIDRMNKSAKRKYINRINIYEQQYIEYLRSFKMFSPLWEKDIFTGNFRGKDEKMLACFFNIWHDEYFGHTESTKKIKKLENRWLFKKLSRD